MSNNKNKFLFSLFGNVRKGPCGLRYWLLPDCNISAADMNMLLSFDFKKPPPDGRITVLKGRLGKRYRVLRFQSSGVSYIAKIFRMRHIRDCIRDHLKHKRYAFSEMKNSVLAAGRGIPTPRLCAYFERTFCGFVRQSGFITEDLYDHIEIGHLLQSGKRTIFDTIPALKELFQKGVNHIDINAENIMMRESDNHFAIIDWQHCTFYSQPNDLQLCFMAARLSRAAKINPADPIWLTWLETLYAQCNPKISFDKMLELVRNMQNKKISKKTRKTLNMSEFSLDDAAA